MNPTRRVAGRINLDLQDDFRLNQPLSLFALEAIDALDREAPDFAWQLLSVIESVLDNPMVVLLAQLDKAKETLISELKRDGVEYEQRMEQLEQVTWPKPEADFLEPAFEVFARHHPWVGATGSSRSRSCATCSSTPRRSTSTSLATAEAQRGCRAALPHRLLQSDGADRTGRRRVRGVRRSHRVARRDDSSGRFEPARRVGEAPQPRR